MMIKSAHYEIKGTKANVTEVLFADCRPDAEIMASNKKVNGYTNVSINLIINN